MSPLPSGRVRVRLTLAGAVLASPEYTLALAVLQGGPYATRRATELADLVLGVVDGAGEREVG